MITISIKRLIRKQLIEAAGTVDEDEDEKPPVIRKPDNYVSDVDGYYFILFLEQEFGKKDLGGIFSRPNGKKYNSGYMKSVKDGKKGVTDELYLAVQQFVPNFETNFRQFIEHVNTGYNKTKEDIQRDKALDAKEKEKQKYVDLANSGVQAQSNFCKFLVEITGLNPAQIQDAIELDPNQIISADGRNKIPKELAQKAVDVFGFTIADFKAWRKTPGAYSGFSNAQIDEIKKKYEVTQ